MRTLTRSEIEAYRHDGVVHVRAAVDAALCAEILAAIDELMKEPSKHGAFMTKSDDPGQFFMDRNLFRHRAPFDRFLHATGLAALAGQALGTSQVRGFYDQIFVKEPGTQETFVWHQDRPYWNVDGEEVNSTWLALSSADPVSSALEFVRGSHRWGKTFRPEFPGLEGMTPEALEAQLWRGVADYVRTFDEPCPDFELEPDRYEILRFEVEPGDALLFDFRTVHRSGPNNGAQRRAAISWRWLGEQAIWAPKLGADPIIRPRETRLEPGGRIDDDDVFPVVWREGAL